MVSRLSLRGIEIIKDAVADIKQGLIGVKKEIASEQFTKLDTAVTAHTRATGATQMEVYVESGAARVRTDGTAATITTGEPLAAGVGAEGCNVLCNNGRAAGQLVDHLHFHIIPRKSGDGLFARWPSYKYKEGRIEAIAKMIREQL